MNKGKFLVGIMCMVILLLTACSQSNVAPDVEDLEDKSDRIQEEPKYYSDYSFYALDDIIQALTMKDTEFYNMIRQKEAIAELDEVYINTLSAFETGAIKLAIPQLDGENIPFRKWGEGYPDITLLTYEMFKLPWIWYHCVVGDFKLTVRTSYVSVLKEESVDDAKTALEVVGILNPDAPNPQNYEKFDVYARIYEQEIQLSDGKVKALIFEMNDDPRIYVDVYMDGMYIRLVAEKELLTEDFFKKFSIRYAS